MSKSGTILVVDDNKSILATLQLLLNKYFDRVLTLSSPNRIGSTLREEAIDVVLLDMNFTAGINTGNEGFYWLNEIKKADPNIQVVLFTAYGDIDLAVRAMKDGATDFVVKPWENEKLIATLQMAYNLRRSQQEVKKLKEIKRELVADSDFFWGNAGPMKELRQLVEKVAVTDANILITGENGTGKEMLAREIHRLSPRHRELLVSVDMGAITETLFESELFGHVKGAFTDARTDRAGKFEVADGGTLFLDEIGNLPYHLQAKLLTVLQSRSVVRVGSNTPTPINIRLISATNRDLQEMVALGQFREDLLYRMNTIHLEIPPLRRRREDIVPLAELFLKKYGQKYGKGALKLTAEAVEKLSSAPWNGNVRELQHTIEKAVIISDGPVLQANDILLNRSDGSLAKTAADSTLEEMERNMIAGALRQHGGNLSLVATQLGVTRQTLYNKIKKYEL
jgi:DNA-binding NtrC family response regulator